MESPGATGSASHRFSFAVFVEADQSAICAGGHIRGGSMAAPEMPSAIRQKRALAFFGRFAGIERVDRVRSGEPQLPHMPDVEEPGFRARVEVLIEDAEGYCTGISKPAKGTIFCAKGEMERVKRGPLQWWWQQGSERPSGRGPLA